MHHLLSWAYREAQWSHGSRCSLIGWEDVESGGDGGFIAWSHARDHKKEHPVAAEEGYCT